jgi:hypothetical protein
MYSTDTNINTAVERQASRVQAVQSYGSRQHEYRAASEWTADDKGQTSRVAAKATLALAAAAPIVLVLAWGLVGR